MKIAEVVKRIKKIKELSHEWGQVNAVIKFMDEKDRESQGEYLENLKKRRTAIEKEFDNILK